jgi:lipopolysaccharide transport system ATP-binding protein
MSLPKHSTALSLPEVASSSSAPATDGDTVIQVENVSKKYLLGHETAHRDSFREAIVRHAGNFSRKAIDMARGRQIVQGDKVEEFWALKSVSFEVKRGEVLGVIGRNGAGKTTLLKILSRITEPTEGRVRIRGRVASLLEVGTGFHPELSGRENIFLNGAILGMSRREIKAKFDEIVDFAEVERFLDTPVKRYSSGMYVRLAFAVAAHLEPEILVIDEVLAVGDVAFQRKCLGKMQNVAEAGRTILFVSHNLAAIVDLTSRTLLIDHGQLIANGPSRDVVSQFLQMIQMRFGESGALTAYRKPHRSAGYVDIESVRVCGAHLGVASLEYGQNLSIDVDLTVKRPVEQGVVNIVILNEQLEPLTTLASADSKFFYALPSGRHTIHCDAGALPLIPGDYFLTIGIGQMGQLAWDVLQTMPGFRMSFQNAAWMTWPDRPGIVLFDKCQWRAERLEQAPRTMEGGRQRAQV